MFDSIVENKDKRGRRVGTLLGTSLGLHAVALGAVLFVDQLRVGPVPEPAIAITFVDLASPPPPPPPPPPPKKRSAPKKVEPKPDEQKVTQQPKEFVSPKDIPQVEEPAKEEPKDQGSDDGVEGGVEGGVAGGVGAGTGVAPPPAPPPPPPPPPKPAAPVFVDIETVNKRRVDGHDPVYPPSAQRNEEEGVVVAKITISAEGKVTDVQILQTHPAFERSVREAIASWRFSPHLVNGQPVAFYTIKKFVFKLQ